jgi:hypothetical protein
MSSCGRGSRGSGLISRLPGPGDCVRDDNSTNSAVAFRTDSSPNKILRSRHNSSMLGTKRSALCVQIWMSRRVLSETPPAWASTVRNSFHVFSPLVLMADRYPAAAKWRASVAGEIISTWDGASGCAGILNAGPLSAWLRPTLQSRRPRADTRFPFGVSVALLRYQSSVRPTTYST